MLVAVDRAVVLYTPHWKWAAREVPKGLLDPYRVEATLRSTEPGRHNVLILGDSVIDSALDMDRLGEGSGTEGRRYTLLTIGGSPTVAFGLLANQILALEPSAIILALNGYTLRSLGYYDQIYSYDLRAVPELFTFEDVLKEPGFHLSGLAGQANILVRRRHSLQRAAAVKFGFSSWDRIALEHSRLRFEASIGKSPLKTWIRDRSPESYPNPNTRAVGRLSRLARNGGARLVVLETPFHPYLARLAGVKRLELIRAEIVRMSRDEGFDYLRIDEIVAIGIEHFRDQTHLNEEGRRIFTEAAIDLFPRLLQ